LYFFVKKRFIVVPNLSRYQHYKNRHMIWVKLYVDILQDYKFCQLKDNERWVFLGLILLAVKNDNKIPYETHYIAKNILFFEDWNKVESKKFQRILKKLTNLKLIEVKMLASCYQDAIPIRKDKIRKEKSRSISYKNIKSLLKEKFRL